MAQKTDFFRTPSDLHTLCGCADPAMDSPSLLAQAGQLHLLALQICSDLFLFSSIQNR